MSERKFLVNKFRIGLVGLVVVALTGLSAGGATAATGWGTASAGVTLLSVDLGNIQHLKVLSDIGQGSLDAARLGTSGPQAFGQLTAVDASGLLNLSVPSPAWRAQAPGTNNFSSPLQALPVNFPSSAVSVAGTSTPIGAGLLVSGSVNPLKLEAFNDASGARSAVGSDIPSLKILQGLISVNGVKLANLTSNASSAGSKGESGVLGIEDITVLDLDAFLGMLGLSLSELNLNTLTGLVDSLGLPIPGLPGLPGLSGADAKAKITDALGILDTLTSTVTSLTDCSALSSASGPLGSVTSLLPNLGLGALDGSALAGTCSSLGVASALTPLTDTVKTTVKGLTDGIFGVLSGAPLLQVSNIELSALANATDTLAGSSAITSGKLGTIKVGGSTIGTLDLNATVDQVKSLTDAVTSKLSGVTSVLNPVLGNLLSIGILERSASTKTEGAYNVANASIKALRVTITPPVDLTGALGVAGTLPISGILGQVGGVIPTDTGLGSGVLASALGLTSLLTQPTTITVGSINAAGDFTGTAAGSGTNSGTLANPIAPPFTGTLPKTGNNAAWFAALAALSLAGAFGITRALRKAPVEG